MKAVISGWVFDSDAATVLWRGMEVNDYYVYGSGDCISGFSARRLDDWYRTDNGHIVRVSHWRRPKGFFRQEKRWVDGLICENDRHALLLMPKSTGLSDEECISILGIEDVL